jgi:prevent-host-death family protein
MLTNNDKGTLAELEVAAAATRLGVAVYTPMSGHARADLVFEIKDRLWRVQCKWGRLTPARDAVIVGVAGNRRGLHGYIRSKYTTDEVDLFGVYCGELDRLFLLPATLGAGKYAIQLRITPPRNKQRSCINLGTDFDFEGAVAQLGERRHGMAEVRGSSPLSSTSDSTGPITVGSNPFRDKLGYWMDRVAAGEEVVITRNGKPRIRLSSAVPS